MEQRLIDANALWELMRTYDDYQGAKEAHDLELIHRDSILFAIETTPTVDAVPVDFINQKIVELQSCASQHFDDGHEILATCVLETIRLLGSFLKECRGKEKR